MKKISEKDAMYDVLNFYKYSLGIYSTMLMETSDPDIRELLSVHLEEMFNEQFEIFNIMSKLGYYQTKPAKPEDITAAKDQANTMKKELI